MDCRSTHRLRIDRYSPIHQPSALAHAGETQTWALQRLFEAEASARVTDQQMNFRGMFPQLHFESSRPAMLDSIVEGFL